MGNVSGKSGSKQQADVWYGTMAGALGIGPASSIEWIIINNVEYVFAGTEMGPGEDVTGTEITLGDFGKARFYWGTETQQIDPTIDAHENHSAYRGIVYMVFPDFSFGKNGETNPPNIDVGWRRFPNQTICSKASGGSGWNDGGFSANPVVVAAELLTGWDWAGLDPAKLNAATFQTAADSLEAERNPEGDRSASAVAPLWNGQSDLKSALADLASISQAWLRVGVDGRIEAGRWLRTGSVGTVIGLLPGDLTEPPMVEVGESDSLPNSFQVEFTDSTKHHKTNSTSPSNGGSVRTLGRVRRQVAQRPMLLRMDQAIRHANELLRENAVPKITLTLKVRRPRAVTPAGVALRPGDYFTFPIQPVPTDPADVRLVRILRREFDPTGPITLFGELEWQGMLTGVTAAVPEDVVADVVPPLYFRRVVPMHPDTVNDPQPLVLLAARPGDTVTGVNLGWDTSQAGHFPVLGGQKSFALPLTLGASLASGATTVTGFLLPTTSGVITGLNPSRDSAMLAEWPGGPVEGANDELLLIIVKKTGGGDIDYQLDGVTPYVEILSINGPPTGISGGPSGGFALPVLRGRQGSAALDFTAGTFPDDWSNYECWVASRKGLNQFSHNDFADLIFSHATSYFAYTPYGKAGFYDPALAYAERARRTSNLAPLGEFGNQTADDVPQPMDAYVFPGAGLSAIVGAQSAYTVLLSSPAHTVNADVGGSVALGELGVTGTAKTTISALRGSTVLTASAGACSYNQFKIVGLSGIGCTGVIESADTVRIETMTADTAYLSISVLVANGFTLPLVYSLSKSKSGVNAKLVVVTSDAQVFQIAKNGTVTPGSITFTATGQNLTGAPVFTVSSGTATLTGAGLTRTLTFANLSGVAASIMVEWDGVADIISVATVTEGANAVTGLLTNESVALPADEVGVVSSYAGALTDMVIYLGSVNDTANWTFSAGTSNATGSFGSGGNANRYTVSAISADSAYVIITAARAGYDSITKMFSLVKSKTGIAGVAGVNAKLVVVTSDAQAFQVAKIGTITPATINFTVFGQYLTGAPVFTVSSGTAALTGTGTMRALSYANLTSDAASITVTWDGQTDVISVVKVREGIDPVIGFLTNEAHLVPCDAAGVVFSLAGATTNFIVYRGMVDDTSNWTFAATYWNNVTTAQGGNIFLIASLTADVGYVDLTATRSGFASITKRFSLAKAKGGVNAKLVVVTSDAQVFQVAKSGTVSPATITFTATGQNLAGSPVFTVSAGSATLSGAGLTRALAYADLTSDAAAITVTWDGVTDVISVAKVADGADPIVGYLTNEAHQVPCDAAGTVQSYAGAATAMIVWRGLVDDTANWTFAATPTNLSGTFGSGGNANLYTVSSIATDAATVVLTASRSGFTSITKTFSLTKSKTGTTGSPGSNGSNGTNGATGSTGPAGAAGLAGIAGADGSTTFYANAATVPSALRVGDVWFVTDRTFEMRRATAAGTANWVSALQGAPGTTGAVFEIIGATTYILSAAIRQVSAGAITAGTITATITITSPNINGGVITGAELVINSPLGMRYADNNHVYTITGGAGNGSSYGAQIDLCGNGLATVGGTLVLAAGNVSTGRVVIRTAAAERIAVNNDGSIDVLGTLKTTTNQTFDLGNFRHLCGRSPTAGALQGYLNLVASDGTILNVPFHTT